MSLRVCVILFVVLIGLVSSAKVPETKGQCIDNTLYAKYVCENQKDGVRVLVPGKCSEYYECSNGVSHKKTCSKFFDPTTGQCVSKSICVEVDNTNCVIPTPPPCSGAASSKPCECPNPPTPPTCPTPPSCPAPTECPEPPKCPPSTECPAPPLCPEIPPEKPPCSSPPSAGPCGNWFDPNDLYGSFVCRNQPDGAKLIVLSNCTDYYYCIGGHSYRKSCGDNRYFNPEVGACDEKSSVYCPLEKQLLQ